MKLHFSLFFLVLSLPVMSQSFSGESVSSVQGGAWNEPSTWDCGCIPGAQNEVMINSGHVVAAMLGDTLRAESMAMDSGSALLLPANSRIEMTSTWASFGEVEGEGTVAFVGEGPHTCGPARLKKLSLSTGVTNFTDTVFIQSQLDLGSGELVTSGKLVLEGMSGLTSDGGTLSGGVIRRYDWNKTSNYTFQVGSALSGALADNLLNQPNAIYAKQWQESQTTYVDLEAGDELAVGSGVTASMPAGAYSFNWQGDAVFQSVVEVHTQAENAVWRGWNLLSNPLTSFVDLNQVSTAGPGTHGATYHWVDSLETFLVQINGFGSFGHQGILAPGDAFWVVADTAYTMNFDAQSVVTKADYEAQFSQSSEGVLGIELGNATHREQCAVVFLNGAESAFNPSEDAAFSYSWRGRNNLDIFTQTSDTVPVMVNLTDAENQVIPLWMKAQNGGALTLSVTEVPENTCLILEDLETGWSGAIEAGLHYEFESSSAIEHHRFNLVFNGTLSTETAMASCASAENGAIVVAGPSSTTAFTLVDADGAQSGSYSENEWGGAFSGLAAGTYTLTALTEGCADLSNVVSIEAEESGASEFEVVSMPDHIGCYDDHGGVVLDIGGGDAPYSVFWDHGDQGQAIEVEGSGLYSAMITDASGCSDSTTVEILAAPQVEAAMNAESALVALVDGEAQVHFQNASTGATGFQWSFGDGATSSEEHPVHVYSEAGAFNVGLNVWNDYCSDSYQMVVTIEVVSSVGDALMAQDPLLNKTASGWTLAHPTEAFEAEVFDLTGRVVFRSQCAPGVPLHLDAGAMPAVSLVFWRGVESGRQKTWRVAR